MTSTALKILGGTVVLASAAAYAWWDEQPAPDTPHQVQVDLPQKSEAPAKRPRRRATARAPQVVDRPEVTAQPSPDDTDEAALMAEVRGSVATDPSRAIELAQEGNARFPDSPDAPERAWVVAKSLAGLGRFHEARDEARAMLDRYPGTPFTLDAERHLLVYPLDQPSREEQQEQQEQL